jgi:uncharacterized protein (UPF0332 family)
MAEERRTQRREVALYIDRAHQTLEVAAHNLDDGFYAAAVNRAYYAIFYAANAMLSTQGLARSKHSGVISAFRERFVKPGLIETEYSRIYGRVMGDRHLGDYEVRRTITADRAQRDLKDARRFVSRVEAYLKREGWL